MKYKTARKSQSQPSQQPRGAFHVVVSSLDCRKHYFCCALNLKIVSNRQKQRCEAEMWWPSWDIASQLLLREHVSSKGVALFFFLPSTKKHHETATEPMWKTTRCVNPYSAASAARSGGGKELNEHRLVVYELGNWALTGQDMTESSDQDLGPFGLFFFFLICHVVLVAALVRPSLCAGALTGLGLAREPIKTTCSCRTASAGS